MCSESCGGVSVLTESLSQQPTGRHSTLSAHGQSDMSGLQHIPENQFPPYATISKGVYDMTSRSLALWFAHCTAVLLPL